MPKEIKLAAHSRDVSGSSAVRRLRKGGVMPAVVNDEHGKAVSIQLDRHDFERMLHHNRGGNLLIDLSVGEAAARKVLLKDVQREAVFGTPIHADFVEVSMTKKMRVGIALRLVGEPVGVSQDGGVLEHLLRELDVECLPTDLVDEIDVDVSALKIGGTILIRDIKVDPKFTILTAADVAVATVAAPRREEEVTAEAAVAAEGEKAEPEVITAKKTEESEEEAAAGKEKGGKEKAEKAEKPAKSEKAEKGK